MYSLFIKNKNVHKKLKSIMCLKEALTDKINCESRRSKDLIWRKKEPNENHNKLLWYNYSFKIATH